MKKGNLLLLELVCNLLIFALCAAVCVGILGKANRISKESEILTGAVLLAQSAAERNRAGAVQDHDGGNGYSVTVSPPDAANHVTVEVFQAGKLVYSLTDKGGVSP